LFGLEMQKISLNTGILHWYTVYKKWMYIFEWQSKKKDAIWCSYSIHQ